MTAQSRYCAASASPGSADKAARTICRNRSCPDRPASVRSRSAAGGVNSQFFRVPEALYHRRSNVESVFSAIKRLMSDSLRSKGDVAMVNETLGKLLAYNITRLVHAIYKLGLEPELGGEPAVIAVLRFPGVG